MGDDWDTVTKIGSKARGAGGGMRETTIKGKSALNAAQRSGAILSTEKKYTSANVSGNPEGQRLTKVDRSDDIVATKKVSSEIALALQTARQAMKNQKGTTMTQQELAAKATVNKQLVNDLERPGADFPPMDAVLKIQKAANVRLTGKDIGAPMMGPRKKKGAAAAEEAKAKTPVTPVTPADAEADADAAVTSPDKGKTPATPAGELAGAPDGDADVVAAGGTTAAPAA